MVAADHLQVPRQHGLFQHHGIDLGDGTVAHYLEGKEILRSPLEEFSCNQPIFIVRHENCSPKRITLQRAISRIGEQSYNLLFNNCEHFATWCKTGMHRSSQIENLIQTSKLGALAIGQLMPKAMMTGLRALLTDGLIDEASSQKAVNVLKMLEAIKFTLRKKLDQILTKANVSVDNEPQNLHIHNLLLQGQEIADELTALEDMQTRIRGLIQKSDQPG